MPDETSARLWGLRAGAESILRRLTRAQKCLEQYRLHDSEALDQLRHEVGEIVKEIGDLGRDGQATAEHLGELPDRAVTLVQPRRGTANDQGTP